MKIYGRKWYCEPLTCNKKNKELIQSFHLEREKEFSNPEICGGKIIGLEAYLKYCAWEDDLSNHIKVYVIKSYFTNEIVSYFSLKSSIITLSTENRKYMNEKRAKADGIKLVPYTFPAIEISHFAVNDNYKIRHGKPGEPLKGLGYIIYPKFIYPILKKVSDAIGVKVFCLFAKDKGLVPYYKKAFGYTEEKEDIIPVMPYYDDGCIFMYHIL